MQLANVALSIVSNETSVDSFQLMDDLTFKLKLIDHIKQDHELSSITLDLIDYVNSNY
tara:strand:+ start:1411 stop:1584 length:174 start_codon:yes stop_codon:yes gene_type:complete